MVRTISPQLPAFSTSVISGALALEPALQTQTRALNRDSAEMPHAALQWQGLALLLCRDVYDFY
jgi:hypothetical protein